MSDAVGPDRAGVTHQTPKPTWRHSLNVARAVLCWSLATVLILVALVRLLRIESRPVFIEIEAAAAWLLIAAFPLFALAALARKKALALIAIVLCVTQVDLAAGMVRWHGSGRLPDGQTLVRIATANVRFDNPRIEELGRQLMGLDVDVLCLQEITPANLERLQRVGLLTKFAYHVIDPLPYYQGSAILSRLPISSGRAFPVAGFPMTRAELITPAGPLDLVNVHVVAPLSRPNARRWRAQLLALASMHGVDHAPLVLAGDFNSTFDHAALDRLVDRGFQDAFATVGRGIGATWPVWCGPALLRLDHVLVTGASIISTRLQNSAGSDHRRLIVSLALPPAR